MHTLFVICAAIGGSLLVIQTVLMLMGGDADTDADGVDIADADGSFQWLSFKALVAFLAFFGLTGLAGEQADLDANLTLVLAFAAGVGAIVLVGWMMRSLSRLQADGSLKLTNAVGCAGTVYVRVPAARSGEGKVTISVQGRSVECRAVTSGPELSSGTPIIVRAMASSSTLEVTAAS